MKDKWITSSLRQSIKTKEADRLLLFYMNEGFLNTL